MPKVWISFFDRGFGNTVSIYKKNALLMSWDLGCSIYPWFSLTMYYTLREIN